MKLPTIVAIAALGICLVSSGAWAQSTTEARLEALEQRIQQLEQRLAERDADIAEKDDALARLQAKVAVQEQTSADIRSTIEEAGSGGIEFGGLVEVIVAHDTPYEGSSTSDNMLNKMEVGLTAQISESAGAELLLIKDDDGKVEVDTAIVTIGMEDMPVSVTAGQFILPFAGFERLLVSDPMALEIGEVGATAVQVAVEAGGLSGSVYAFNGGVDYGNDDRIDNFGVQADYGIEFGDMSINAGIGWVNDLRTAGAYESDDGPPEGSGKIAGVALGIGVGYGPVLISGHLMSARDEFDELDVAAGELPDDLEGYDYAGEPARPSAYGLELAYTFSLADRDATVGFGWQRTLEAAALEMPESRLLAGLSSELVEGVGVAVEFAHHSDYGPMTCTATHGTGRDQSFVCGGTGKDGRTISLLLSAEF